MAISRTVGGVSWQLYLVYSNSNWLEHYIRHELVLQAIGYYRLRMHSLDIFVCHYIIITST